MLLLVSILTAFLGSSTARIAKNHSIRHYKGASYEQALIHFQDVNQKLYRHLMGNYTKELSPYYTLHHIEDLPPGWTHPPPMPTDVTLVYARIVKLDQVEQVMRVIAQIRMIWNDYRLRWDPAEFGGIEHIYINRASIWVPEIAIANSEGATDAVPEYKQNVLINYTGHVHHYYAVLSNSVCLLQTDNFPFDEQKCWLNLLETFFNKNESVILASINPTISYELAGNGEWMVTRIKTSRAHVPEYHKVEFDLVRYQFTLKRKAHFYVIVIIIPTFIITALTITGIFGKKMSGEDFIGELSLGLTSLMTMTVMLGIVADSLPKTNHIPVLSIFLTGEVSLMALSILLVVLHPKVLYPPIRKIRSKVFRKNEDEEKTCCFGLLPASLRKYKAANLLFLIVFQGVNIANLWYILSYWT